MELNDPVHAKHYKDGYPLCWGIEETGIFEATYNEAEVTCEACLDYMKE